MIGKYKITVENEFLKFEFTIKRNITIVRGNSATGKTTLIEMIDGAAVEDSGINLECEKKCVDNYFVIVTREKLSNLPYSVQEVYGIRERGKYAGLAQEYTLNEFYQIYGLHPMQPFTPDVIIAEDSNSGYDFWKAIAQKNHIVCKSAEGKNKVLRTIRDDIQMEKNCLAVVDGAAFGPELEEVLQYIKYKKKNVEIYAPESFEYLILASGMWKDSFVKDICDRTYDYADSVTYVSWERFYTAMRVQITEGTERKYSKPGLNAYYLSDRNIELIMKQVPDVLRGK